MYRLLVYDELDDNIEIKLQSMQQVLDFLSLLNLSFNTDLYIQLSYERRADFKYDETKQDG